MGSHIVAVVLEATDRVYQLTFYKAGSQWVRDVLADPRVLDATGFHLRTGGVDVPSEPWPVLKSGEIAAPVYCATPQEWENFAAENDRAVVVLRDPRDIVVSLAASFRASHAPSHATRLLRGPINAATPQHRLLLAMFAFSSWSERLRSWAHPQLCRNAFVTSYCKLVADQYGEFARIFDFLEWNIPASTLREVIAEHDFASRTGRTPGEENAFSHRRKGQPGDWRNHFDIETGRTFEESFPRLLTGLGYEPSDDWWRCLDAPRQQPSPEQLERGQWLRVLEEFVTELTVVRAAAAERLEAIHTLTKELGSREIELEGYRFAAAQRLHDVEELTTVTAFAQHHAQSAEAAADERLRLIESLSARVRELETAATERSRIIESLNAARIAIEQSWSYKLGFAPLRRLFGLFKDRSR